MLNMFVGSGRLCKDPERRGKGDNPIASFRIAIDNGRKDDQRSVLFLDCTAFGSLASVILDYSSKGSRVNVRGRLCQDDYVNQDGYQVRKFYLNVDGIDLLDGKKEKPKAEEVAEVSDDELPF